MFSLPNHCQGVEDLADAVALITECTVQKGTCSADDLPERQKMFAWVDITLKVKLSVVWRDGRKR